MFGIGETELVIIVVFAFLLFGPDKLPGMGRTLGRVLRQFREASDGFTEVVQTNIMDPASEELEKSPKQRKREAAEAAGVAVQDGAAEQQETTAEAPKRETFAERKARLIAERKAAEEAAAASATSKDEQASPEQAGPTQEAAAPKEPATSEEKPREQEASASTSAADLYAMTSRKSTRMREKEAAQNEEQHASEPAPEEREEAGSDKA